MYAHAQVELWITERKIAGKGPNSNTACHYGNVMTTEVSLHLHGLSSAQGFVCVSMQVLLA